VRQKVTFGATKSNFWCECKIKKMQKVTKSANISNFMLTGGTFCAKVNKNSKKRGVL